MKISSETQALILLYLHSDVPKNSTLLFIEEFSEVGLGKANRWHYIVFTFVLWIGGKRLIKRAFLAYPQLWIILFVSLRSMVFSQQ